MQTVYAQIHQRKCAVKSNHTQFALMFIQTVAPINCGYIYLEEHYGKQHRISIMAFFAHGMFVISGFWKTSQYVL